MAVVSPVLQDKSPIRYPDVQDTRRMGPRSEIVEETPPRLVVEDKIYIAVGKDVKDSELTLKWALHKSGGRRICILHVHQPAEKMPILGTKVRIDQLEEQQVRLYHENERQQMHQLLEKYYLICQKAGVRAEKLYIEMESIERGIVTLIQQHDIKILVMGAAADRSFTKKMLEPKSKKALSVRQEAPDFCRIYFICKGNLIYTREGRLSTVGVEVASPSVQERTNAKTEQSGTLVRSATEGHYQGRFSIPAANYRRARSDRSGTGMSLTLSPDGNEVSTPPTRLNEEGHPFERNMISRTPSTGSQFSKCSSGGLHVDSALVACSVIEGSGIKQDYCNLSPASVLKERGINDELLDQLIQAMAEADNARLDAFEESIRRRKAEKDAIEAMRRAKASERSYEEECNHRREIEEALARGKEDCESTKQELDKLSVELRIAQEQNVSVEGQIANSEQMVHELEQKLFSAVELLQSYKEERDELQLERDEALRVAEELRKKQAEESSSSSTSNSPLFFSEFSFSEVEEATCNFDESLKIGKGGYGSIYKGVLRHTQVAIKMLNPDSLQGPLEFQQEVNVLGKMRHPNLVTLIGACQEAWILIYEYLPNGSLEDRLNCKHNTPPLSWQTRIQIAAELCSVLIFLHSCGIVHGDLKPANVLLDSNMVSKLSDFGICRVLSKDESSASNSDTLYWRTQPKGTFAYIDPEFLSTGELTSKSDVYSFGIILLRLLTGKPAVGITKEVQYSLEKGNLKEILDPTAGDWPFVQAKQLACLALNCCEVSRRGRPELSLEVWRVLEPMRLSCGATSCRLGSEDSCQIPHYFVCPIFQEIMQDPVVGDDGFTYEAEAIRGWLDAGHNTSPITDRELANSNLTPNLALRFAIQEWLQHR